MNLARLAQLVERHIDIVEVTGSSPVPGIFFGSTWFEFGSSLKYPTTAYDQLRFTTLSTVNSIFREVRRENSHRRNVLDMDRFTV